MCDRNRNIHSSKTSKALRVERPRPNSCFNLKTSLILRAGRIPAKEVQHGIFLPEIAESCSQFIMRAHQIGHLAIKVIPKAPVRRLIKKQPLVFRDFLAPPLRCGQMISSSARPKIHWLNVLNLIVQSSGGRV